MTDKKEMAKVSIIIPVYNSEKYIRKCLNSIRNQTYKNYEVIVPNDGSKDNSLAELKKYKQEFQDFNLMIIAKGAKIKTFKYIGYNWSYNNKSISNTKHKDFKIVFRILEKFKLIKFVSKIYCKG